MVYIKKEEIDWKENFSTDLQDALGALERGDLDLASHKLKLAEIDSEMLEPLSLYIQNKLSKLEEAKKKLRKLKELGEEEYSRTLIEETPEIIQVTEDDGEIQ